MNKIYKKTILLDLDGVLNTYTGEYDKDYIPPIRNGAIDLVKNLSTTFNVVIFTSRNILVAIKWILNNNLGEYITNITNVKEPCYLMIDDRCIQFKGDYAKLKEEINDFKVWYK